jgi:hypothetical protein
LSGRPAYRPSRSECAAGGAGRYIDALADQITSPFAGDWMPVSLKQYDSITRDEYLRSEGVSEAALRMMNLGSTPVARFRSFLDVRTVAVNREPAAPVRRRAVAEDRRQQSAAARVPASDRIRASAASAGLSTMRRARVLR